MIWKEDVSSIRRKKIMVSPGNTMLINWYYEEFDLIDFAIKREKQIKGYSRAKKVALIEQYNKEWKELSGR